MGSPRKATDGQIREAYAKHGSVWKAADELGMCGQSVHERLHKIGVSLKKPNYTEKEKSRIEEVYAAGFAKGDGSLDALAEELDRPKTNICRWARQNGLTDNSRGITDERRREFSERAKASIAANGHPRGMKGKSHTRETRDKMSQSWVNKWSDKRKAGVQNRPHGSWKAGWRTIGGQRCYFRSRWEANYARYLEWLRGVGEIEQWEHEPETFWFEKIKRGCRSYLPDFRVTEKGEIYYVEVKGWMDDRSKTKLKRMAKYHPDVDLRLVDSKVYRSLAKDVKCLIDGWE